MGPDAGITGCNSKACVTYEARLDDQNVPIWLKKKSMKIQLFGAAALITKEQPTQYT